MERVFGEHFQVQPQPYPSGARVSAKADADLTAASLQSPDDLEATYRQKRGKGYQDYSANLTEPCDPHNALQLTPALAAQVQVLPKFRRPPIIPMIANCWRKPYPT
ncbi:MAG: hypothetical protein PHQ40_11820 [Anaerolineaceae bacterium]|nr:hypothetical protein [Anaerolineaceae bacterium]